MVDRLESSEARGRLARLASAHGVGAGSFLLVARQFILAGSAVVRETD